MSDHPDSPWRYEVALTPMIPGIWMAAGVVRAIQKLDELERRILLEGVLCDRGVSPNANIVKISPRLICNSFLGYLDIGAIDFVTHIMTPGNQGCQSGGAAAHKRVQDDFPCKSVKLD